jgi:hypothetical protein
MALSLLVICRNDNLKSLSINSAANISSSGGKTEAVIAWRSAGNWTGENHSGILHPGRYQTSDSKIPRSTNTS